MQVRVHLYGDLMKYLAPDQDTLEVSLDEGADIRSLVSAAKIDEGEVTLVLVNGQTAERNKTLKQGDTVRLFSMRGCCY